MKHYKAQSMAIYVLCAMASVASLAGCSRLSETIEDKSAGINGSFEVVESGLPVNWLVYTPEVIPTGDYDLIIDTSDYKHGKQSLNFLVRECSDRGGRHSPGLCNQYEAVPGETYKISYWVKNHGCEFVMGIGGVTPFEGDYETMVKSKDTIEAWTYFEHQYRMPLGKKFRSIRFYLNILQPGSFWIDDVKIEGPDGHSVVL